jgi:CheY-like chemotaxis protein
MKMLRTYPNVKIRMGTTLEDMEQDADGVTAIVTNEGGEQERIRGSFIISGEGARSVVRKASNIAFEGYTYPDQVLTVSVVHDFDKLHGYSYRNYLSDPDQWANLFKWGQPERWRVHFPTSLDDDPEMQEIFGEVLEQMGCEVTRLESGEAALRACAESLRGPLGAPDLMVVDYQLPGMNGGQLAASVKALGGRWSSLPMVLSSGDDSVKASDLGLQAQIQKPPTLENFIQVVRSQLPKL